jgi:hypothetical protein
MPWKPQKFPARDFSPLLDWRADGSLSSVIRSDY